MIWTASAWMRTPAELQENLEAAGKIVREQMDEFFKWLDGKESDPENSGNQRKCSE